MRLKVSQERFSIVCGVSKRTYMRWEKEVAIPADKLSLLVNEGLDVQYVVTGVRSQNLSEITHKPQRRHFDFEGKLKKIICILEEELDAQGLELDPEPKAQVIEGLLMQAIINEEQPTKENVLPFLKVVGL